MSLSREPLLLGVGRSSFHRGRNLSFSSADNRRDDVSRQIVLKLQSKRRRVLQPAAQFSRRVLARGHLEFVLGTLVTATLGGASVAVFLAPSAGAASELSPPPVQSVRTLVDGDVRVLVRSLFYHDDGGHFAFNLLALLAAGVATSSAPTFLYRWVAIPVVFVAASAASGTIQLGPDLAAACESLPGGTAALQRGARQALDSLCKTWDVAECARVATKSCSDTATALRARPWIIDRQPTRVFGTSAGVLGLSSFAALEWAVGGAGAWPALLVPMLICASGAGSLLSSQRVPPQGSALETVSPALARSVAQWRWGHAPPPAGSRLSLSVGDVQLGGGIGDLAGLAAGVACWCVGRGLRWNIMFLRVAFAAVAGVGRRVLAAASRSDQPVLQRFSLR